jgi:hypothetical protein
LDLKRQTVTTVAGTGKQGRDTFRGGPARLVGLNSPWGLLIHQGKLYIGMAGHHQIWVMDLTRRLVLPFAGTGKEALRDGPRHLCCLAQPSGLASDGANLYIADCESSAIRAVRLDGLAGMKRLVGKGLFVWGDTNGKGDEVRLQHPLDVVYHDGKVYVADTYNHKIKVINPLTRACTTLDVQEQGDPAKHFHEPSGLSIADGDLYVADTNAHRIRVIDLVTRKVSTLRLRNVEGP